MSVFLTGGSGFVGLNIIEQLLTRGDSVVSYSLAPPPTRAKKTFDGLPGRLRHVDRGEFIGSSGLKAFDASIFV